MIGPARPLVVVVTLFAVLTGCASKQITWRPLAADIETADYGAYPRDYESIVKDWYLRNLKDPDSARFGRITRPLKEHAITKQFKKDAVYGYSVCAAVNARSTFGGYTGRQTRWFLIRTGRIVRSDKPLFHIYIGRPYRCIDGPLPG